MTYDKQRCLFGIQKGKLKSVGDRGYADKVAPTQWVIFVQKMNTFQFPTGSELITDKLVFSTNSEFTARCNNVLFTSS